MSGVTGFFKGVAEYLTPVLSESALLEKGVLTPEEFVRAGDELVYKCPTWAWEAGEPAGRKPYLPADKQFLVTRSVPCMRRARELEVDEMSERMVETDGEDDGWLATDVVGKEEETAGGATLAAAGDEDDIEALDSISDSLDGMSLGGGGGGGSGGGGGADEEDEDDVADLDLSEEGDGEPAVLPIAELRESYVPSGSGDEFGGLEVEEDDDAAIIMRAEEPEDDTIVRTRTYDLSITYDKYYQTPRMWLYGFDESRMPLAPEAMFDDIMSDYVKKTVFIEKQPHLPSEAARVSIHPCKHADVMKKILGNLVDAGTTPTPEQYMFVFLKLLQSVVPTINYDYTMTVKAG